MVKTTLGRLRTTVANSGLRKLVLWKFGIRRVPLSGAHYELSVVSPLDEAAGSSSVDLLKLGLQAAQRAMEIDLHHLHERSATAKLYLSTFPGEHYHLLAALIHCVRPARVTEIGTFTGLSALTMLTALDRDAKLTTYDIVPWDQIEDTALRQDDFVNGHLEQRIGNLADARFFKANSDILLSSDLIFVDGPKDGRFEPAFIRLLLSTERKAPALIVLDDIRLWNMLRVWADLPLPKLDITSFGHWSGTGLCWIGRE